MLLAEEETQKEVLEAGLDPQVITLENLLLQERLPIAVVPDEVLRYMHGSAGREPSYCRTITRRTITTALLTERLSTEGVVWAP